MQKFTEGYLNELENKEEFEGPNQDEYLEKANASIDNMEKFNNEKTIEEWAKAYKECEIYCTPLEENKFQQLLVKVGNGGKRKYGISSANFEKQMNKFRKPYKQQKCRLETLGKGTFLNNELLLSKINDLPEKSDDEKVYIDVDEFNTEMDQMNPVMRDKLGDKALRELESNIGSVFNSLGHIAHFRREEGDLKPEQLENEGVKGALARNTIFRSLSIRKNDEGERDLKVKLFPEAPPYVANDILSNQRLDNLPELNKIVNHPYYDDDIQLIDRPGFHTNGYYIDEEKIKDININFDMTYEEGLENINYLLQDVNFKTPADKANMIGLLILPFVYKVLGLNERAALHIVRSPNPGSGKSTLLKMVGTIATGSYVPAEDLGSNKAEIKKSILSTLIPRPEIVSFDNAEGFSHIESATLAKTITEPYIKSRILGKSEMKTVPTDCIWMMSGNQLEFDRDIVERSIIIDLEPFDDATKNQEFEIDDMNAYLKLNRSKLVSSIISIVEHWKKTGSLISEKAKHRMKKEAYIIGGILEAIGINDFLENDNEIRRQSDPKTLAWKELYDALVKHDEIDAFGTTGENGFCATDQEVFQLASVTDASRGSDAMGADILGKSGIITQWGANSEMTRRQLLSKQLKKQVGVRVFNYRLVKTGFERNPFGSNHNHQVETYKLEKIKN